MNIEVVEIAEELLQGSKDRKEAIGLHELIWTIDAQERLIPNADEINEALKCVGGFLVERSTAEIQLHPSNETKDITITQKDLEVAMKSYRDEINKT
jgi:hypothetical protein